MAFPYTESGHNMFDMLSMLQKAIRRSEYGLAGFAAHQLCGTYRQTLWNRLMVTSAEDCFGVLTKEITKLREGDMRLKDNQNVSKAVFLMCMSKKNRDACYFACNFVLASRKPREIALSQAHVESLYARIAKQGMVQADPQLSLFPQSSPSDSIGFDKLPDGEHRKYIAGASLQKALKYFDMDMIGHEIDILRRVDRDLLWKFLIDYSAINNLDVRQEIESLMQADTYVNKSKKALEKDEIFISKAAVLLCHAQDTAFDDVLSCDLVNQYAFIDWDILVVPPIENSRLVDWSIPKWVYDCHTLIGKKMGKTDWDMTVDEQKALYPLQRAYFDDASWIYTYEQDFDNNAITHSMMLPIREYAKTHPANPVKHVPYELW